MGLNRYKLGDLIELSNKKNDSNKYGLKDVKGISNQKIFIDTKANMEGVSLKNYLIITPDSFCYVPITSRNGEKITIAHNTTKNTYIVSSSYIAFTVKRNDLISSNYLFMYFNRPEFDRFSRFNSWGSAREAFSWDDLCNMNIELPPLSIQQKFVDVYNAMVENQKAYENGINDLKLVCDAYISKKIEDENYYKLGNYIIQNDVKNTENKFTLSNVKGFNDKGNFITPMRLFSGDITTFRIIDKNCFVYNPRIPTTKFPVALNKTNNVYLVTPADVSFSIKNNKELLEEYLIMILQRTTFSRKVLFNTWGSSTPFLKYEDLCEIEIPIPNIEIQRALANIYNVYTERNFINEELKTQIKNICPILIKGSLEEDLKYEEKEEEWWAFRKKI